MRTFLTDSAYSLISGLSLNSENNKEAVNVLKERFDNKQTLSFSYMDSFVQLRVSKNSNDVVNLRKLYDRIEIIVRNFVSLEVKKRNLRKFVNFNHKSSTARGTRFIFESENWNKFLEYWWSFKFFENRFQS